MKATEKVSQETMPWSISSTKAVRVKDSRSPKLQDSTHAHTHTPEENCLRQMAWTWYSCKAQMARKQEEDGAVSGNKERLRRAGEGAGRWISATGGAGEETRNVTERGETLSGSSGARSGGQQQPGSAGRLFRQSQISDQSETHAFMQIFKGKAKQGQQTR